MELLQSAQFANHVQKLINHHSVTGIAISLVQDQKIVSLAVGKASLESSAAFTPDSLIPVGSLSKSLTAAAVALLVHDNERYPDVQYGTPIASFLPDDFVMPGDDHNDVTLEDVLSHRTGMAPHELALFGPSAEHPDSACSVTRNLRNLTPVAPNRTEFIYCNMMYTVATHVIEKQTKTSFGDFLEAHLLQPLHMNSTALFTSGVDAKGHLGRVATGYLRCKKTQSFPEAVNREGPERQGASEIYSSASDYAKWIKALINREGPITDEIYESLTETRVEQDRLTEELLHENQLIHYAFGWDAAKYDDYTILSHAGGDIGYQCIQFFMPELKFGGVIFSNSDQANTLIGRLKYRLIDERIHGPCPQNPTSEVKADDLPDNNAPEDSEDDYYQERIEDVRQHICPGITDVLPQELPLSVYTGQYWNPGYRNILVEEDNGSLVVNAQDRSLGFKLTFIHVCDQTKYVAVLQIGAEPDSITDAEFVLAGGTATKVGIHLEERLDEMIWFERVYPEEAHK